MDFAVEHYLDHRLKVFPWLGHQIFRRMFELKAQIPIDKDLYISIKDYDLITSDDIIGETIIDLENRFLTKYRATVGLPQTYCEYVLW